MYKFYMLIILVSSIFFACGDDAMADSNPRNGRTKLIIKNLSEFDLEAIYIHSSESYLAASNILKDQTIIDLNRAALSDNILNPQEIINFPECDYMSDRYVTFVRQIASTNSQKIAITTKYPLKMDEGSGDVTLKIFEENFKYEYRVTNTISCR